MAMPAFAFLAVAGLALITLLFLADAALDKDGSPVIVTSQRSVCRNLLTVLTTYIFSPPHQHPLPT
jgi:hypothetical protein